MHNHIINYTVRIFIIIMGVIFLSGYITPPNGDTNLFRVMGVVLILFGAYRIANYRRKIKHYEKIEKAKVKAEKNNDY